MFGFQPLRENTNISYDWSYFVAWVGVGFSLISAILFSGAAICLRGEREKEEAMNMQYLMPGTVEMTSDGQTDTYWLFRELRVQFF